MPALALKVGLLPLDAGDVTPSTDGSAPYSISAPRTPNGAQYSSAVPLIVYSDDAGYILAESVTIPAYSDRIRYSLDGVTYGAWGVGAVVPAPITPNGSQVFMQCRGVTGDPDIYPFTVSLPAGSVWQAFGASATVSLDLATAGNAYVDSLNAGTASLDFAVIGSAVVVANAAATVALDFAISGDATTADVSSGAGAVALDFALTGAAVVGSVAEGAVSLDLAVAGGGSVASPPSGLYGRSDLLGTWHKIGASDSAAETDLLFGEFFDGTDITSQTLALKVNQVWTGNADGSGGSVVSISNVTVANLSTTPGSVEIGFTHAGFTVAANKVLRIGVVARNVTTGTDASSSAVYFAAPGQASSRNIAAGNVTITIANAHKSTGSGYDEETESDYWFIEARGDVGASNMVFQGLS